jgi:hypothetical protein
VEARLGREADARAHAGEALELCSGLGLDFFALWALDALSALELGLGRLEAAFAHLEQQEALHERTPDRFEEARTRLCHGEGLRRRWPMRWPAGASRTGSPS